MTLIEIKFPVTIPYRFIAGKDLPSIPITLIAAKSFSTNAVVDTGAEKSLMSADVGIALGLKISTGEKLSFCSAIGTPFIAYGHIVNVTIEDLKVSIDEKIWFPEQRLTRNLLGRDLLKNLIVGIKEMNQEVYLSKI